ncbi:hypothetical protein PPMP20_13520 [Paraburkholderia phymatum]|uniref:hypothetical protein n=1 Tax=Paraburkholderia phymatum TaxID=148447 RepID=UPI00142ED9F6|nr:hypothetical protein [Paraburkholderia phymatum]
MPSIAAANVGGSMDAVSTALLALCEALAEGAQTASGRRAARAAVEAAQQARSAIGQMRIIADFPSCYYRGMCHNRSAFL